jgi:predicted helicase
MRETYYTGRARGFICRPRNDVMKHFRRGTIGIDVCRFVVGSWCHVMAICDLVDDSFVSNRTKERGYAFPLYTESGENLSVAFRSFIDSRYEGHHYGAEEILGYIYAVLHAPTYRRRYAEFLRIDFPRIPFTDKREDFETLSRLGSELIEAHLLKDFPRRGLADYHGRGDNRVEKPRYVEAEQRVFINDKQSFAPVPKEVWDFHIGGYQVLDKYLKSRKGRTLSLDEINHVAAVADVLAFTIEQMEKIDGAWRQAFPDRG